MTPAVLQPGQCSGCAAALAFDQTLAEFAAPLEWGSEFFPDGSRPSLKKIFPVRVCREGKFDGAVVDDLSRDERHEFLNVFLDFHPISGGEVKQEMGVNDLRLVPCSFVAMAFADPNRS